MSMADSKEIEALEPWEHVLIRPTVYVGSLEPSEDRIPLVRNGRIHVTHKEVSVGFYKMFNEILDNAVDEAKRMKGRMKLIRVEVDSKTNRVTVQDTGDGFKDGEVKNRKTKKTNVETALGRLMSGSNFKNEANTDTALIGTNGLGASIVNVLSDEFSVHTVNKNSDFYMLWEKFKSKGPEIERRGSRSAATWKRTKKLGTTISFVPRKEKFKKVTWDREILHTMLVFKRYLLDNDQHLKKLKLEFVFDGEDVDVSVPFLPKDAHTVETPIGTLVVYESFDESGSLSFVNSAMCTGIHQRIINETINAELDDPKGHHFYETFLMLNLAPKLVRFRDQNKTRLDTTRLEIEDTIKYNFRQGIKQFFGTPLFARLLQKVEERKMATEKKKLRAEKKKVDVRNSPKYFPPSGRAENLFIVEGESAMGSILQKRDTKVDGVYRLKGKIKNVRSVSDLSGNQEVIELMQILNLNLDEVKPLSYKRVIIATDADEDGGHITALLVNLFFKWFPYVIDEGKLYRLRIPLLSVGDVKKRQFFFDKSEYEKWQKGKHKPSTLRFLKGLGSLAEEDWEVIMKNKQLQQLRHDDDAKRYLDMAFGRDSMPRKQWLQGKFK